MPRGLLILVPTGHLAASSSRQPGHADHRGAFGRPHPSADRRGQRPPSEGLRCLVGCPFFGGAPCRGPWGHVRGMRPLTGFLPLERAAPTWRHPLHPPFPSHPPPPSHPAPGSSGRCEEWGPLCVQAGPGRLSVSCFVRGHSNRSPPGSRCSPSGESQRQGPWAGAGGCREQGSHR